MKSTMRNIGKRITSTIAIFGLAAVTVLGGATTASATKPEDAPPGYAGPYASCPGVHYKTIYLPGPGYIDIWYSSANSGTFCVRTFDNAAGSHHIEVILRREDWQKSWYDSGPYTTYAGAISVYGVDQFGGLCVQVWGRVVIDGVDYNNGWDRVC